MYHIFLCYAVFSVHCCLVITCWERHVFLALLFELVHVCSFHMFCLCQMWFLIVLISDLCLLLYCYFVCKILTEEQRFVYSALIIHVIPY